MTFVEKARKEHPERVNFELGYPTRDCPHHAPFDYPDTREDGHCAKYTCRQCWNREIPEESHEEPVEDPKPKTAKKTKVQLLEELAWTQKEVARLNEEVKRLERYSQYDEAAGEIYAMQMSFENSGFTREEAFKLVMELVSATFKNLPKR